MMFMQTVFNSCVIFNMKASLVVGQLLKDCAIVPLISQLHNNTDTKGCFENMHCICVQDENDTGHNRCVIFLEKNHRFRFDHFGIPN